MTSGSTPDFLSEGMKKRLSRREIIRRGAILGVSVPAAASLLAACGGGEETPGTSAPSGQGAGTPASTPAGTAATGGALGEIEEPQNRGGQLVEGNFSDAATLNPVLVSDVPSGLITDLIFNGVITINPATAEPEGELAQTYEISDDGLTYTFVLRDGVMWHDGEPLSADDVKFTFDLLMNGATGSPRTAELTERVKSVDVTADNTVQFTLNFPVASFIVSNVVYGIVPEHILSDVDPATLNQDTFSTGEKGRTIGTGPFMFEEWVKDDHITLVRNPDYWQGEPVLDRYIYRIVPDQTVLAQQMRTGELDYSGSGGVTPTAAQDLQNESSLTVTSYDTFDFTYYAYQLDAAKSTLFQEKEVRQALLYALDRQAMIDVIRFGYGEVAVGTMPRLSWAYNPDAIELKYEYDPDRAKQLLDDAGWTPGADGVREKNGQRLAFTLYTNSGNQIREQYVTVMQQAWREIGVECTPQTEEWNALIERITTSRDFEMFLIGFSWDVDPDQTAMWSTAAYEGGFNMNKYSNPEVDRLLQEALQTTDQDERKQLYTEMQNILLDDLPSAVLDFPKDVSAFNKRVHNVFPNDIDDRFNAHQWWVDEA